MTITNANPQLVGFNTFTNLTWNGTAAQTNALKFSQDQIITGTLTLNGNSNINRALICSNSDGSPRVISAGAVVAQYCDFMDIYGVGAATWNLTGSTGGAGDCGGNVMQALGSSAFTTAVDQHWQNASSGSWSNVANWTSRIPLPQDNVFMDKVFGTSQTVTADMPRLGKSIDWTGATWTTALTFTTPSTQAIFGSMILISGLTWTANGANLDFYGRGSFSLKGNGVTINQPVRLYAYG